MASKKGNLHEMAGAVGALAAGNTEEDLNAQGANNSQNSKKTQKPKNAKKPQKTKKPTGRPRVYEDVHRFSFNIDGETYKYLKAAAYNASSPEHMVTVTEYVNRLIKADKDKNEGVNNE